MKDEEGFDYGNQFQAYLSDREGKTFAMKSLPESWYLTGCVLYAGVQCQPSGFRYPAHNRNWNLLLLESGRVKVIFRHAASYTFVPGDLVLLAPGPPREFHVLEPLKIHWIHFNLDAHLQYRPEWPSREKNVFLLQPPALNEFLRLFSAISDLCTFRQKGWYRLGYCLIQEILLRGNMLSEKGLDQEHIDFAARILRDVTAAASITELAEQCHLSRAVFFRKFRETFGMSPAQYREQQKLNYVRELLENTTKSVKEIAEISGFADAFYLSHRFRKMFGISPREYRRNYLDNLSRDQ